MPFSASSMRRKPSRLLASPQADVEQPLGPFAETSQRDRALVAFESDNAPQPVPLSLAHIVTDHANAVYFGAVNQSNRPGDLFLIIGQRHFVPYSGQIGSRQEPRPHRFVLSLWEQLFSAR